MALNGRSKRSDAENKYMDELLDQLMSLQKDESEPKELQIMDTVLDYINRQSQYLAKPKSSKRMVDLAHAYIDAAKKKEIDARMDALSSEPPSLVSMGAGSNTTGTSTSTTTTTSSSSSKKSKPSIFSAEDDEDDSKSSQSAKKKTKKAKSTAVTTATSTSSSTSTMFPDAVSVDVPSEEKKNPEDEDEEDESDGPKLVGNGGTNDVYSWTQTLKDVEVNYRVPLSLRGRDLIVEFTKERLKVAVKGADGTVFSDGEFHARVNPEECSWTLDSEKTHKTLTLFIVKQNQMEWWKCVVKGDPEINTKKIEPENSKLDDLDDDTRQTVEKMMFDQRQKMRGLPTTKEREQADMLAKLQAKFPDMDFSKAQFSGPGGGAMGGMGGF